MRMQAVKLLTVAIVCLALTGCKEILATYKNVTETWCSYVTSDQYEQEKVTVMALIKKDADKAEAERILGTIGTTSEYGCEALKALRAAHGLSANNPN